MLQRIHARLGTAGFVISIVALVVALGGGAYAASGGLTGKQKKEVEKIAKSVSKPGKTGAAGPAGPAGAAGAKGDAGTAGTAGTNGVNGTNGANGTTGFTSTLPSGKTETGTFAYDAPSGTAVRTAISFPIPLAAPLGGGAVHLLTADGTKEVVINESSTEVEEVSPNGCGTALSPVGTATKPAAAAGNLCVYLAQIEPGLPNGVIASPSITGSQFLIDPAAVCEAFGCLEEFGGPGAGAGVTGSRLEIDQGEASYGYGTWAVTAP